MVPSGLLGLSEESIKRVPKSPEHSNPKCVYVVARLLGVSDLDGYVTNRYLCNLFN